jgi:two-component system response regulator HydG
VIASTSIDIRRAVETGAFREDLFYRLAVVPIVVPPLRERFEDLPALLSALIERLRIELNHQVAGISRDALSRLLHYDFPGNLGELRYILERAIVTAAGPVIHASDLELPGDPPDNADESLESIERQHIARVLQRCSGNISQAARVLRIDRATLYHKIRKYHLPLAADRHPDWPAEEESLSPAARTAH